MSSFMDKRALLCYPVLPLLLEYSVQLLKDKINIIIYSIIWHTHTHTYKYIYIHTRTHAYAYVCVCVCLKSRPLGKCCV